MRNAYRRSRMSAILRGGGPLAIILPMKLNRYFSAAMLLGIALAPSALAARKYFVYVGTYTGETSKGIYTFEFDPASGVMTAPKLAAEITNPSFLTIHPNRKF